MESINTQVLALALVILGFAIALWQMYKNTQ
jgi:hypothetical protein